MKIRKQPGYVLLEILPALMLLLGALAISVRLLAHTADTRVSHQRLQLMQAGIIPVWQAWQSRGGNAALVSQEENGSWRIRVFPDPSWLPSDPGPDRSRHFIYRREPTKNPDGWKISVLAGNSTIGFWIEQMQIMNFEELQGE